MGELDMDNIDRMILEEFRKQELKDSLKNMEMNENKNQDNMLPAHNLYIEFVPEDHSIRAS